MSWVDSLACKDWLSVLASARSPLSRALRMSYSSEAANSAVVRGMLPALDPFDDASATSAASSPRSVAALAARLLSASLLASPLCPTKALSASELFEETTPGAGFSLSAVSRPVVGSRAVVMFAPRPELSAIAVFVMN